MSWKNKQALVVLSTISTILIALCLVYWYYVQSIAFVQFDKRIIASKSSEVVLKCNPGKYKIVYIATILNNRLLGLTTSTAKGQMSLRGKTKNVSLNELDEDFSVVLMSDTPVIMIEVDNRDGIEVVIAGVTNLVTPAAIEAYILEKFKAGEIHRNTKNRKPYGVKNHLR